MALLITSDFPAIALDDDGVARVGGTRVRLDTIVTAYKLGAVAEDIALSYDALSLADIYGAIAYYLRHTAEVDEYLRQRGLEAERIRRECDSRIDRRAIRKRIKARREKLLTS